MKPTCRSCGRADLLLFLTLGTTPLANSLLRPEDAFKPEPRFPLDVAFCRDCSLVQITETVPPEELFSEYLYFSSFSTTMVEQMRQLANRMIASEHLGSDSLVVEIASNDGYLLQWYLQGRVPVVGIEPARNIAKVAVEKGIPTECAFFGRELADQFVAHGRRADVVHANNVLAHVADLNGFVRGIATILRSTGVAIIEVPYVRDLVDNLEFDTIYHEHLCYFSLTALVALFARHQLSVVNVEHLAIHGGTLRCFVAPNGARIADPCVQALLAEEHALGLDAESYYKDFSSRVEELRTSLKALLTTLKSEGKRLAAYGASAKGSTLLNTFGIGRELLDFTVDRNTHKQGRLMPGVHVPIAAPEQLLTDMPDHVLLLTWNFATEILEQQSEYRRRGGRFIIPVPAPRII